MIQETMENEEISEIIGCSRTMLDEPDNAICGRIVGDFGNAIAVELYDGNVAVYDRGELLIFD